MKINIYDILGPLCSDPHVKIYLTINNNKHVAPGRISSALLLFCTVHHIDHRQGEFNREGQPDGTPVDKYDFTWITKRRSMLP